MGESERRRKYRYNRVLIESERILNPQFSDAVIYLTGAQIEMLRNVTQYLNRLETYVTEYASGYYLAPTVEDYDSILEIVADLEEVLMGNPNTIWGYKDRWHEANNEESTGEANTYVSIDPVPEGYVYVLEYWNIAHFGGQACAMVFGFGGGGSNPMIYDAPAVPTNDWVYGPAGLTMEEGDYLTLRVVGLPVGEIAQVVVWGHKMVVPV